jgi:hypothetical protein
MTRNLLTGANLFGPLELNGSTGTVGQALLSGGPGALPTWGTIGASQVLSLTSTQQTTSTALADVTQLVGALATSATYLVDCFVTFQTTTTFNGVTIGFTSPTGCNPMVEIVVPVNTGASSAALSTRFPNAAATTSGSVSTTGSGTINTNHTARLSGIIKNGSTAGNFQIQFASETNGTAVTLQIGSTLQLTRIA